MKTTTKFKTIAATLAAVALLASCNVNDHINEREVKGEVPVKFTAAITAEQAVPQGRASGTEWAATDKVGIFMVQGSTALAENKEYGVQAAGATAIFEAVAGDEIYYPRTGTVDFIAYYPYVGGATLSTPIDVEIETTQTATNKPTFDLLYSNDATGISSSTNAVALGFKHKLSKLSMSVKTGDGITASDLAGMTVRIKGMNTKNSFDLSDASFGAANTVADITPRTVTDGVNYEAIILPSAATQSAGQYSVDFTIYPGTAEAETFTWNMAAGTEFRSGYVHTYVVEIARTGVTATGTITDWLDTPEGNVTAE